MRLLATLPGVLAVMAAPTLFSPYISGWGCKPTPASIALVLVWLLPALASLRALVAVTPDRRIAALSWVLALAALYFVAAPTTLGAITGVACR